MAVDKGKLTKSDKEDIERSQAQLRAVGLIGPDVDIVDAVSSLQTSGVAAYYSPKDKKITIKAHERRTTSRPRGTIAHELTHALQDQRFDLRKLQKAAKKVHGSTALQTVVEGDAVRIQDDYVRSLSEDDQAAYERERAAKAATAQTEYKANDVPESLSVLFEAPYDLGPSMLEAVLTKKGVDGIDALFEKPPVADASFVTPTTVLEDRVYPVLDPPKLQTGETRSGKPDVFGALALYQMLASRLDAGVALTAADAWGGDAMVTFTRDGTTCLRSTFQGTNAEGTTAIGDALTQWAALMPAGAATVDRTPEQATLTACDPGAGATEGANGAMKGLVYLASRDSFFAGLLQVNTVEVADCTANRLVRDPAFQPVLDAATADPTAAPDEELVTSVRSRLFELIDECGSSTRT